MIYLEEFLRDHNNELLWTGITLLVVIVTKFVTNKAIRKVGRLSTLNEARTRLVIKYFSFGFTVFTLLALTLIWGVNFRELGILLSSVFAVIGVALFAQWSILSNVTSGIILFFSFPFKIGDRIHIMDKEIDTAGTYIIEDIRAYHIHLRKENGELLTYPNNMMLQKAVLVINEEVSDDEGSEAL